MSDKINSDYRPMVLVADDDMEVVDFIEVCLKEKKCNVTIAYDGETAIKKADVFNFDLAILDIDMPRKNGLEVCKYLKSNHRTKNIPIIMITALDDINIMTECFTSGADEFLRKPLTAVEIFTRTKAMLRIKFMRDELEESNKKLLEKIDEKTQQWHQAYDHTVKTLASAIQSKDRFNEDRNLLVSQYAVAIAEEMGLDENECEKIRKAAELHDIGNIAIDDEILTKNRKPSPEEWEKIKKHAVVTAQILKPLLIYDDIIDMIISHHEKYDGTGYPDGKKGEQIPLGARIIAVADAYEAMTSDRPQRKALTEKEAKDELIQNSGKQFDPKVVEVFLKVLEHLKSSQ